MGGPRPVAERGWRAAKRRGGRSLWTHLGNPRDVRPTSDNDGRSDSRVMAGIVILIDARPSPIAVAAKGGAFFQFLDL
jgi:hypothetical protein